MIRPPVDPRRFRLAVVASHPVQYYAPWYRALTELVDVQVFFAHRTTTADHARSGFGLEFEWDVPLLDGYRSTWLSNVASHPSPDRFFGCNTPQVASVLANNAFDAVLVTGWNLLTYWQAIRAARHERIAVLVRGDSHLQTHRTTVVRALKRLSYPSVLRSFDACLAVGTRNAEYYRHYGVPPDRIFRSPHCVDNAFFAKRAESARRCRGQLRRALGIPVDAVVFAFVGKMTDHKRPLDFVEAIGVAGRTHQEVWGLMMGDGPQRQSIQARCDLRAARCVIGGFMNQAQIAEGYAVADVLVLPSAGETWGLVVNEAMACGLPVIASDAVGCAPDLVLDGETGFTYPCGDIEALASRMQRFATDACEREDMGRRARECIRAFSPQAAAAGVATALRAVVSRESTAGRDVFDAVS